MKAGMLQVGSAAGARVGFAADPVTGDTREPERHNTVVPTEGTIENSETNVAIKKATKRTELPRRCVF